MFCGVLRLDRGVCLVIVCCGWLVLGSDLLVEVEVSGSSCVKLYVLGCWEGDL